MKTIKIETMLTEKDVEVLRDAIKDAVNNGEKFVIEIQRPGLGVRWHIATITLELNLNVWDIDLYPGDNLSDYDIPKNTLVVIGREVKGDGKESYIFRQLEVFYNNR
jgi:hypothetical protein